MNYFVQRQIRFERGYAMRNLILSVDLGTTSILQALFDENGRFVAKSMRE